METNDEYTRVIDTRIRNTKINHDILDSVIGQMSDGIWENTNGMTSYWSDVEIIEDDTYLYLAVIPSHSIMYRDYSHSYRKNAPEYTIKWRVNKYANMTDAEILKFFKNKIRCIVKHEDKDNLELSSMTEEEKVNKYYLAPTYKIPAREDFSWNADNDTEVSYLDYNSGVTVGDAYKVCKTLERTIEVA